MLFALHYVVYFLTLSYYYKCGVIAIVAPVAFFVFVAVTVAGVCCDGGSYNDDVPPVFVLANTEFEKGSDALMRILHSVSDMYFTETTKTNRSNVLLVTEIKSE